MCEIRRRRSNGLNGHRQHEQQTKQRVTLHSDLFHNVGIKQNLNWEKFLPQLQCYYTSPMEQVFLSRRPSLGDLWGLVRLCVS